MQHPETKKASRSRDDVDVSVAMQKQAQYIDKIEDMIQK